MSFFVAVIALALLLKGASEIWFSYQEHKAALIRIQREQAEAALGAIGRPPDARAEALAPAEFVTLAEALQ